MSALAPAARLRSAGPGGERPDDGAWTGAGAARTGGWLAFCALAVYGTLRWDTMLEGSQQAHVAGSLGVAVLSAVVMRVLPARRWLTALVMFLDLCAVLVIAGFPLAWLTGLHLGALASELSHGISTIPDLLVPYRGDDPATAAVLALGGGALLACAGLLFGAVRGRPATEPLALVALPLVVLAIVPSTIVRPQLAFIHGFVTFVLVVALVLTPRLNASRGGAALLLLVSAVVISIAAVAVIEGNQPWVRYADGGLGASSGIPVAGGDVTERFNWRQSYGPLGPQSDETVLSITAQRPAYWKAEDLDAFNGQGWTAGASAGDGLAGVSQAHRARYSEQLSINVDEMSSPQVIAAGVAFRPNALGVRPAADPGTWTTSFPLTPGTQYGVRVYAPTPSPAQLAGTGRDYPAALAPLDHISLPGPAYTGVRRLARRLAAGAPTPIGYVEAVLSYLSPAHGFVYTLDPPPAGADPLASFLLDSHQGYCQQFAGAMALLLRLDGIPARVAVGFSPGTRRPGSDTYDVEARDAHAWVEAWFPSYGWVTFDPTPGQPVSGSAGSSSATRLNGRLSGDGAGQTSVSAHQAATAASARLRADSQGAVGTSSHRSRSSAGGLGPAGVIILVLAAGLAGLGLAGGLVVLVLRSWRRPTVAELTAEVERAFGACGRPLSPGVTLGALEHQMADAPLAAGYLRALSAERYARPSASGGAGAASRHGRAALRHWLAQRAGRGGALRALWALPPRRAPR